MWSWTTRRSDERPARPLQSSVGQATIGEKEMRLSACAVVLSLAAAVAQASDLQVDIDNVRIRSGNTTIHIGDRDKRGYYWDGKVWRDPAYWKKHHDNGKHQGKGYHCPPGQAKKGNC